MLSETFLAFSVKFTYLKTERVSGTPLLSCSPDFAGWPKFGKSETSEQSRLPPITDRHSATGAVGRVGRFEIVREKISQRYGNLKK